MAKILFMACCLMSQFALAQAPASPAASLANDSLPLRPFLLGEVVVTAEPKKNINGTLTARRLQDFARNDVSKAMNLLPGVHLSAVGPRNEAMVYVRGFDLRQVPCLLTVYPFIFRMTDMWTWPASLRLTWRPSMFPKDILPYCMVPMRWEVPSTW